MKTTALVFTCFFIVLASVLGSALTEEEGYWLGASKATLKNESLVYHRTLWNAMSRFVGPFGKSSRMILVRNGKCLVINGGKDLDKVREFPVLNGDRIQKYDEKDLKEWDLPILEGAQAVALLVAEENKRAADTIGKSREQKPLVSLPKSSPAPTSPILEPRSHANLTQAVTVVKNKQSSSTPWTVVAVLTGSVIGLLWLLLKNRRQDADKMPRDKRQR